PTTPARIRFCSLFTLASLPSGRRLAASTDAAFGRGDELDEVIDVRRGPELGPDALESLGRRVPRAGEELVPPVDLEPGGGLDAGATKPHDVDAAHPGGVPLDDEVWRYVLGEPGAPAHQGQGPDAPELVDGRQTRDERPVPDLDEAGQARVARQH